MFRGVGKFLLNGVLTDIPYADLQSMLDDPPGNLFNLWHNIVPAKVST